MPPRPTRVSRRRRRPPKLRDGGATAARRRLEEVGADPLGIGAEPPDVAAAPAPGPFARAHPVVQGRLDQRMGVSDPCPRDGRRPGLDQSRLDEFTDGLRAARRSMPAGRRWREGWPAAEDRDGPGAPRCSGWREPPLGHQVGDRPRPHLDDAAAVGGRRLDAFPLRLLASAWRSSGLPAVVRKQPAANSGSTGRPRTLDSSVAVAGAVRGAGLRLVVSGAAVTCWNRCSSVVCSRSGRRRPRGEGPPVAV